MRRFALILGLGLLFLPAVAQAQTQDPASVDEIACGHGPLAEVLLVFWEALGDDETGTGVGTLCFPDVTVTIQGDDGGGSVAIHGSNDCTLASAQDSASPANTYYQCTGGTWFVLTDTTGTSMSYTTTGQFGVLENPKAIRPVTASGTSTDVDVYLHARRNR